MKLLDRLLVSFNHRNNGFNSLKNQYCTKEAFLRVKAFKTSKEQQKKKKIKVWTLLQTNLPIVHSITTTLIYQSKQELVYT